MSAVTLIPPHRISTQSFVEARVWSPSATKCRWISNDELIAEGNCGALKHRFTKEGNHLFRFEFMNDDGQVIEAQTKSYEVVETGVRSTRTIDGCWVSLVHWSEDESRYFNTALKTLNHEDWIDQIRAMNAVGIKSILIQNVFDSAAYAGRHSMTADTFDGVAFYPSRLYPKRYPIACEDPIEAIFQAADECEMTVFLGVGLFAWFDYSPASLEWHYRVTDELFERYGHHLSLYSWYMSEEMLGSLYAHWEGVPEEQYTDIAHFFHQYTAYVNKLTPTKPVSMAPNNILFHEYAKEWGEILPHLDILIPFAFARDPDNLNIREIQEICDRAETRFWVDMEMFQFPFDEGLVPKSMEELEAEIRFYDSVEQIFGYQFTGLMNFPESKHDLGGEPAKQLYRDYLERHRARRSSKS